MASLTLRRLQLPERQREVLAIYDRLHAANAHKWKAIPVCVVPEGLRK